MTDMQQHQAPLVHSPYDRNAVSFSDMIETAVEVQGNQLVKEELADELVGVPFLITKLTFRRGMKDTSVPKDSPVRWMAYVSAEAVIADAAYLASRKINLDDKPFLAGDHIVLNDGSTGIYRQVVAVLESQGYIVLPEGPVQGAKGQVRFDAPPSEWEQIDVGESWFGEVASANEGFLVYTVDCRIFAPRGLRLSSYSNDYASEAQTRYLA